MGISDEEVSREVLTVLLRINERLEALERLLQAQLEHSQAAEARLCRMFRALAIISGSHAHDND